MIQYNDKYILVLYVFNSIDTYLRPVVSCRLYTTIIRQKKDDCRI